MASGTKICVGRAVAAAISLRNLVQPGTVLCRSIEIIIGRNAQLACRREKGARQFIDAS